MYFPLRNMKSYLEVPEEIIEIVDLISYSYPIEACN